MHVVICLIYGFTIWFSMMAYAVITGVSLTAIVIGGPVVVSCAIACLVALDYLLCRIRKLWA